MKATTIQMYDAALAAVSYVGMANYPEREEAAKTWLAQIFMGDNRETLDQVCERRCDSGLEPAAGPSALNRAGWGGIP